MKKLSKIDESVWGDLRKRSSGEVIRKEDKLIIGFGISEMYDYLRDSYKDKVYWIDGDKKGCIDDGSIGMDPVEGISMYFDYGEDDKLTEIVMFYTIKSFSEDPKEYPEFFKKLSNAFNVSIYNNKPEFSKQWTIRPKSGELTNKTVIDVIEFFLNNEINESAWGDMRKRSSREQIRKEDDVNLLDRDGLYDYLTSHYKNTNSFTPIYNSDTFNTIKVPFLIQGGSDGVYLSFEENEVSIPYASPYKVKGLFSKLADEFSLKSDSKTGHTWYIISPKDGSEVTNTFFIYVIDFLIDNIPDSFEKGVKKIVEESAWGDMRKRSSGEVVRKEDDINNLDRDGLYEYIFDLYEQINPFPTPLKSQTSQTYTYFSIPIFKSKHKAYRLDCTFDNSKISKITLMASDVDVKDFKQILIDNFDCILRDDGALKITAKDGTVSNRVCMDLIKVIVENAPEPLLKKRDV